MLFPAHASHLLESPVGFLHIWNGIQGSYHGLQEPAGAGPCLLSDSTTYTLSFFTLLELPRPWHAKHRTFAQAISFAQNAFLTACLNIPNSGCRVQRPPFGEISLKLSYS